MSGNGEIKIEKGVPRPPRRSTGIPWSRMKVGDSVFIPRTNVYPAGRHRNGFRFSQRLVTENGVRGMRIWRVE